MWQEAARQAEAVAAKAEAALAELPLKLQAALAAEEERHRLAVRAIKEAATARQKQLQSVKDEKQVAALQLRAAQPSTLHPSRRTPVPLFRLLETAPLEPWALCFPGKVVGVKWHLSDEAIEVDALTVVDPLSAPEARVLPPVRRIKAYVGAGAHAELLWRPGGLQVEGGEVVAAAAAAESPPPPTRRPVQDNWAVVALSDLFLVTVSPCGLFLRVAATCDGSELVLTGAPPNLAGVWVGATISAAEVVCGVAKFPGQEGQCRAYRCWPSPTTVASAAVDHGRLFATADLAAAFVWGGASWFKVHAVHSVVCFRGARVGAHVVTLVKRKYEKYAELAVGPWHNPASTTAVHPLHWESVRLVPLSADVVAVATLGGPSSRYWAAFRVPCFTPLALPPPPDNVLCREMAVGSDGAPLRALYDRRSGQWSVELWCGEPTWWSSSCSPPS